MVMQMKTKNFRDEVRDKMKPLAVQYLDTIIYFRDYEKSDVHEEMIDLACSFVKGTPYEPDEDMRIHTLLRKESLKVTSHLDEAIGFSGDVGFRGKPKHVIEALGVKLVDELCKVVLALFPDPDSYQSFKDGELKPTKLETPHRRMMSCMK